jgi:hypothetical protein
MSQRRRAENFYCRQIEEIYAHAEAVASVQE